MLDRIPVQYLNGLVGGNAGGLKESQDLPHLFTRPRQQLIILKRKQLKLGIQHQQKRFHVNTTVVADISKSFDAEIRIRLSIVTSIRI